MAAELVVSVRPTGQGRTNRMTRGIVTSARRADQSIARSARRGARSAQRASQRANRARQQGSRQTTQIITANARSEAQAFDRAARSEIQSQRRVNRERRRGAGASPSGRPRRAGTAAPGAGLASRIAPAAATAAVFGGVIAVLTDIASSLATTASAVSQNAGGRDFGQRVATAQNFEAEAVRLSAEVGASRRQEGIDFNTEDEIALQAELTAEINRVAAATNQQPGDLLQSLRTVQTEFGAFDFGLENLEAIGREAQRSGDNMEDLARFAGQTRRQFGDIDPNDLFNISAQAGLTSSLTTGEFASNFAGLSGVFRSAVDPSGERSSEELTRDFIALANVIRTGTGDAASAATQTRGLLFSLAKAPIQEDIAVATGGRVRGSGANRRVEGGIQLQSFRQRDAEGNLTDATDINAFFTALSQHEDFQSLEDIAAAVPSIRGAAGLNTALQRQREGGASSFGALQQVSAEAGEEFRNNEIDRLLETNVEIARGTAVLEQIEANTRVAELSDPANLANEITADLEGGGLIDRFLGGRTDTIALGAGLLSDDSGARDFVRDTLPGLIEDAGVIPGTDVGFGPIAIAAAFVQPLADAFSNALIAQDQRKNDPTSAERIAEVAEGVQRGNAASGDGARNTPPVARVEQ